MGIRNLSPHLCNSAILRTIKSIAELRSKKFAELPLRTFHNSATFRSLLPVPLLSSPFSSVQYFYNCLYLWKPRTGLTGTVARDFYLRFFFMNQPDSTDKNMQKIAEMNLSSCWLEVADFRKNYDCGIAELRLWSNISLKSCGIASFQLRNCDCGLKKKVPRAHSDAIYSII